MAQFSAELGSISESASGNIRAYAFQSRAPVWEIHDLLAEIKGQVPLVTRNFSSNLW